MLSDRKIQSIIFQEQNGFAYQYYDENLTGHHNKDVIYIIMYDEKNKTDDSTYLGISNFIYLSP